MNINKRFIFLILACIFILISLYFITTIYGKYLSATDGTAVMPISKWNIKVNSQNIKDNADISNTILPTFPGNDYIAANIIAPTATGYFDLVFDFSAVDVSFKYEITTQASDTSAVSDLVAVGYSIDGGEQINFDNYNETITKTILLADDIDTQSIRIYVMWNDDPDTSNMNNIDDTASTTLDDSSAKFDVKVTFTQITGN